MSTLSHLPVIFLLVLISISVAKCVNIEETVVKLREKLQGVKSFRVARDSENTLSIWEEYEFDTGTGNREELIVTNISSHEDPALSKNGRNRHFLRVNDAGYLTESTNTTLSIYKLNENTGLTEGKADLETDGKILALKIVDSKILESEKTDRKASIVAILCVQSERDISLRWYEFSGKDFKLFWRWPVEKRVQHLEVIRHADQNKLLLLGDTQTYFGKMYSPIEIYSLIVDFENQHFDFWVYQRKFVPKASNIGVCPIYESAVLAVQTQNQVLFYDFTEGNARSSVFEQFQNISSNELRNFVCFESGYIQYLAISGPEAGLFNFFEKEFLFEFNSESFFNNFAEISWIQDLSVETYRDEALLLVQLKNSSVIALSWQGTAFKTVPLPNKIIDSFDLSRTTVIPKYGFVFENIFVRIETQLRNLARPVHDKVERMLKTKILLQEVLDNQEAIIDETEVRLNGSYFRDPTVTGFWNLSRVEAVNVTIMDDVVYRRVSIGSNNITAEDIRSNVDACVEKLKELDGKLGEIRRNIQNAVLPNSRHINLTADVEISGNIRINGTLKVKNLTIGSLNGVPMSEIRNKYTNNGNEAVIKGRKIFPTLDSQNIKFSSLNGIPLSGILFDSEKRDYDNVDFSNIRQLIVDGHLKVSALNGIKWDNLMERIVWKNKPAIITGNTVVEGEVVADRVNMDSLNEIEYPSGYVLSNDPNSVEITGAKNFETLTIANRLKINNINDVPISDYVILDQDQTLDQEITFENLRIDGNCEVDGSISGVKFNRSLPEKMLNETTTVNSDVIFGNLTVLGNIYLENSINGSAWSNFNDLLQRTDKSAEIIGRKTFLNDVKIGLPLKIQSNKINGHPLEEFVTLDTEQEFPNLRNISADVTFGKISDDAIKGLEDYLKANVNEDGSLQCAKRELLFETAPIIDELYFNMLNSNISGEHFEAKLNETFHEVHFENLTVTTLLPRKIIPQKVNGVNFTDFENRRVTLSTSQNLTGAITIERLKTDNLLSETINDFPLDSLPDWKDQLEALHIGIFSGAVPLKRLTVTKKVEAKSVNAKPLENIYRDNRPENVVFEEDVFIRNLTILGLINNLNFSEFASDAILKTDTDIVVTGHKTFGSINCIDLEMSILNGRSVENVLDPRKEQIFIGPVTAKGAVNVEKKFDTDGKINDILFDDLRNRFKSLGNNTFQLRGDFRFANDVSIKNLHVNGTVGKIRDVENFLNSIISKNDDNITLAGSKIFENSVTFGGTLVIGERLNDINLKRFYEKAVCINKLLSVDAKIIFLDDVVIEQNLTVNSELETLTIAGVDLNELEGSVLYVNRPQYIIEPMILANAIFESDVSIEKWNDVDMKLLIPLKTDQVISSDVLICQNVSVKNYDLFGTVNGYKLDTIYNDTFLLTDEQRVRGNITFHGNVKSRHNFDAQSINGINPKQIVLLNDNDTMIGNFVFEKSVTLNGSLRVLQYLNDINPMRWEVLAVMSASGLKQIISANWTVHGDVHFRKNILGDGFFDGIRVKKLADTLKSRTVEMRHAIEDKTADQNSICEDLNILKHFAENQIYRFNTFEYLQVVDFDRNIAGIHYFESNDLDHLLISYDTCHMGVLVFDGAKFNLVSSVDNFGIVNKWITLKYQNESYFLALGKPACGRSSGNLWKIRDDQFEHVTDFGNITDARKIDDSTFLIVDDQKVERRSIGHVYGRSFGEFRFRPVKQDSMRFIRNSSRILLTSEDRIYEYDEENLHHASWENQFGSTEIFSLQAGPFRKEMFIYHGQNVTADYVFICSEDISQKKVLQTIKTHNPKGFLALNLESKVETLLIFAENNRYLQIYEYKGIQGFVYRDSIQINVDALYNFTIRKYRNLTKRHCIAVVYKNRLTILQAKMYGEKLDMDTSSCPVH